jgi:hypothetical protein
MFRHNCCHEVATFAAKRRAAIEAANAAGAAHNAAPEATAVGGQAYNDFDDLVG